MKTCRQLSRAAMLAGALVAALVQAEAAHRLDVTQFAANKADLSPRKTIEQIRSTPPRKKKRCYG